MSKEKYSIRKNKNGRYDIFLSGFVPMYCASYNTKEECRIHIKNQITDEEYKNIIKVIFPKYKKYDSKRKR